MAANGPARSVGTVSPCCPAATQQRSNAELHPCTEAGSGRTRQGQERPRQSAGKVTRGTSTGFLCPTAVLRRGLRSLGLGSNLVEAAVGAVLVPPFSVCLVGLRCVEKA